MDDPLTQLRSAMDVCNRRLVDVLHERARLARAIGAWKQQHGLAAVDPGRERAMRAALLALPAAGGFAADQLAAILDVVFAASRQLVEPPAKGRP